MSTAACSQLSWSARLRPFAFPLLLATIVTLWLHVQPLSSTDSGFALELNLASPVSGEAWMRFRAERDWNDRDAVTFFVNESAAPRTYRVPLPAGNYRFFRLLSPEAVPLRLTGARLVDSDGAVAAEFLPAQFDPVLHGIPLALPQAVRLPALSEKTWAKSALDFALLAVALALAAHLLRGRKLPFGGTARALVDRAAAHPKTTLFTAATLAVVVSCFPVVFCGKSFVSPNNGALLLYDEYPTIPGAPASPVERWNNSDVNAMPWQNLPYSMVTRDAVLRDGSLPLWNRYVMCGLTLLGQGLSMPGDPLFWITVAADGASWAWDVRFLISKLLFAFGIGLVVWKTARHLPIALVLAFSSAFLGFFSYRFNHPAFFSICYSPWMLLCWLHAARAQTLRSVGRAALLLVACNWCELNSGTAKEASMCLLVMNATGALILFFHQTARWKKLALMVASCAAFLAISAPILTVFLEALKRGFTIYGLPRAWQLPAGLLIGLFDDLFPRQLMAGEFHVVPALNFLVLVGVLWAVADFRRAFTDPAARAVGLVALPLLALVFGVIPPAWITRVPFLGNIIHVDNTFICTLIVPLFVLAGFGLRSFADKLRDDAAWQIDWFRTLVFLVALTALYLGSVQVQPRAEFALQFARPPVFSSFFIGYVAALLAAVALLPWCVRQLALAKGSPWFHGTLAVLCFAALHFRHGMWLETKFDDYVMNPQVRADLHAESPALHFIQGSQSEPSRVMGLGQVLRPGFNIVHRLECPTGADAVASKELAQFCEASGISWRAMWWPTVTKKTAHETQAIYDALNVRYYLGSRASTPEPAPGLKKIATADLDIFESETAWPRAFFTDRLSRYRDARQFANDVKSGDRRPLAAVLENELGAPALAADQTTREIVGGCDYRLTANTTSFTVNAPRAGVAVLNESFVPDNFRARVNGQPVPIFRVNHIFKGVSLPAAGTYRITFEYRPRQLAPALFTALGGLFAVGAGALALRSGGRSVLSV